MFSYQPELNTIACYCRLNSNTKMKILTKIENNKNKITGLRSEQTKNLITHRDLERS